MSRKTVEISRVKQLQSLRKQHLVDEIKVYSHDFKYAGVLLHAVKFSMWALKQGGELIVIDSGPSDVGQRPLTISFEDVLHIIAIGLKGWGHIKCIEREKFRVCMSRSSKQVTDSWSAGVIFSGRESELPLLEKCIAGLLLQKQLTGPGGEIVVCGPRCGEHFVAKWEGVNYLTYEAEEENGRFLIGKKKNFLVGNLRNEKCVVLHCRIALEPGSLGEAPPIFDVMAPQVTYEYKGKRYPYLDYLFLESYDPNFITLRRPIMAAGSKNYLSKLKSRVPHIDGGVFIIRKELYESCPISPELAWGEAEDMDWCARLNSSRALIEYCPEIQVSSQTYKMGRLGLKFPPRTLEAFRFILTPTLTLVSFLRLLWLRSSRL